MKGTAMKFLNVRQFTLGTAAACMLVSTVFGMPTANADRDNDTPVGANIIRSSERGQTRAQGTVRSVHIGALNGGQVSAAAPIILSDGNAATLPCGIKFVVTSGQPNINWPC